MLVPRRRGPKQTEAPSARTASFASVAATKKRSAAKKVVDKTLQTPDIAGVAHDAPPKNTGKVAKPAGPPPIALSARFFGKFDLYSMKLPFLRKKYLPEDVEKPAFEELYDEVLVYQAKPDFSLCIALKEGPGAAASKGIFSCSQIANPMSDEELEPIYILNGATKDVAFSGTEAAHSSTVGKGPRYTAKLDLDTGATGCGMMNSGTGTFKMRKVWEDGDKELFEGYWTIKLKYAPTLKRKGFGSGGNGEGAFWAVRARRDTSGDEIGIDADWRG